MGLKPLEFADGITDSPFFRATLQLHEREIDKTNSSIKQLLKDIRELINAARNHSRAQRSLSETLNKFNFECIGNSQTDDELVIAKSFSHFANLLKSIEDERDRLLEKAEAAFLEPIEKFRRNHIGAAKEAKKKFDKETAKHYQSLERYLATSTKKGDTQLLEADASYAMEQRNFFKEMSDYVLKLQEVNERKKFEFVESVLSFMIGWITFYHQGHEIANDFYSAKVELQTRLQRTRNNFQMTQDETQGLRQKLLNNNEPLRKRHQDNESFNKSYAREGYLFLMEKKAFSTSWTKHFCQYDKRKQRLKMIHYNQTLGKVNLDNDTVISVRECIRRDPDTIDRRFCFDIVSEGDSLTSHSKASSSGNAEKDKDNGTGAGLPNGDSSAPIYTFQALSEDDYKQWMDALDGRDPTPVTQPASKNKNAAKPLDNSNESQFELDEEGACFVRQCIKSIESKGLEHKGIYRIVGVASKVRSLIELFAEKRKQSIAKRNKENIRRDSNSPPELGDNTEDLFDLHLESDDFEIKTVTSALKNYLRNLIEPIMTFHLNNAFISAAKVENRELRIAKIHFLVHMLPPLNFGVLKLLIHHLQKISMLHEKNMMTPSNLGVCFGPTLLRTKEESVAAILDIKFVNVIAEILIENYEQVFLTKPNLPVPYQEEIFMSIESKKSDDLSANSSSASSIQTRPLPHVPTSLQFNSGNNIHSPGSTPLGSPISRALGHGYAYNQMVNAKIGNIKRSSSQDQLSNVQHTNAVQNSNRNNRQGFYGTSQLPVSVQRSGVVIQNLTASPRKPGHPNNGVNAHLGQLSPSSSPASSSNFSAQAGTGATQQAVYQPPMVLKSAPVTSTSGNGNFGHINRQSSGGNLGIQPSMSFQNLHYNSELSAINSESLALGMNNLAMNSGAQYSRPMTSIGYLPMNPYYEPIKVPNQGTVDPASQMNPMLTSSSSAMYRQPLNPYGLSSSSSLGATSLPTTPDTLNPPTQFGQVPYRGPVGKPGSISPQPTENIYEPLSTVYGQQLYGPLGNSAGQNSALLNGLGSNGPGATVRTKYPCQAGSKQELSFNSNVIITNVRSSREPGWLEGCLNGQTGLIPKNYVEFISE